MAQALTAASTMGKASSMAAQEPMTMSMPEVVETKMDADCGTTRAWKQRVSIQPIL